jgi:TPR repeat protein
MYAAGEGVSQDYVRAVMWYRKAADQGDDLGQLGLGLMYLAGHGAPQDDLQAYMWLNLAVSKTSNVQIRDLAVRARDLCATRMTPAQIAEAQRMASEWVPK